MEKRSLKVVNSGMSPDAFSILVSAFRRHAALRSVPEDAGGYSAVVYTDTSLSGGRYVIEAGPNVAVIRGESDLSLFAGLGRFLDESSFDGEGGFEPFTGVIDFTPAKPLRGMYFATHFHNFYHDAPIEKVYEVIEDLALRGCNTLFVWFDMHHFASMDDPGAEELTERLRAMLKYANRIGIAGAFTMLANEAFSSSPESLRAEWTAQNGYTKAPGDHFHVEICPSKPGGVREILAERRAMLERFADLDIRYVSYWPYDQGGCTCEKCSPWGANGFLRLLPPFNDLIKEFWPKAGIILSTWYFDRFHPGEWAAFYPHMTDGTLSGVEYVMSFFFNGDMPGILREKGIPDGIKLVDFPEISMYSCSPWGGFGASALPAFLDRTNAQTGSLYCGGYPYSEGIFEDVNKYLTLTYYSGRYPNAADAVRSYVRYEFCVFGAALDELTGAILRSEKTLARKRVGTGPVRYEIADPEDAGHIYSVFCKYNALLPEKITKGWKFRLWYLRAVIDRELVSCDGIPLRSEIAQRAMRELCDIYSAGDSTKSWVKPPLGI